MKMKRRNGINRSISIIEEGMAGSDIALVYDIGVAWPAAEISKKA